jgi:hypothetical protein
MATRAEDDAPAIEKAAELVSELTRLLLCKMPTQLRIGLAIAKITRGQEVDAT